jgi:hypothetical protein
MTQMEGDFACLRRSAGPLPGYRLACTCFRVCLPFLTHNLASSTLHESLTHRCTGAGQSLPIAILASLLNLRTHSRHSGLGNSRDNGVSHVTYLGRHPLAPQAVLPGDNPTNNASPIVRIPSIPPSSTRTPWPICLCSRTRKRLPSTTRAYGLWVPRP